MASYFDIFFQKGWNLSQESDFSCSYIKLQRSNNIQGYLETFFHCNLKITNKNGEKTHCTYQCNRENNMKRHTLTNKHKCNNSEGLKEMIEKIQKNKGNNTNFT
jgi:hypothetical protein